LLKATQSPRFDDVEEKGQTASLYETESLFSDGSMTVAGELVKDDKLLRIACRGLKIGGDGDGGWGKPFLVNSEVHLVYLGEYKNGAYRKSFAEANHWTQLELNCLENYCRRQSLIVVVAAERRSLQAKVAAEEGHRRVGESRSLQP
jgi:hypothetical protein